MNQTTLFVLLFCIIAAIAILFRKTTVPTSLLLVIAGMFISYIPDFPHIGINPDLVLDVFLPLLIYETSAYTSWVDIRKHLRPIVVLSVGHVIVIATLVAVIIHALIPQLGWPLAFVLGAVVAPPDDVAIISISKKTQIPHQILTILVGESMFNDATALILFRFSLAALATHEFYPLQALSTFFIVVISQTIYGLFLGHAIGQLRLRLNDPVVQVIVSLLTPFLAYLPANYLSGSGVIATVVTGLVIGHTYTERFAPDVRITSHEVWTTLSFLVQSMIFLLVGLDMRFILMRISSIPTSNLALYCSLVLFAVIAGRFLWVYAATYLPSLLFRSRKQKKYPLPSWQHPFIISWAGMRGGISLAAAVAIPYLPATLNGASPRDLIIFLVFTVIAATLLLQGLALPWILKKSGVNQYGETEKNHEHSTELSARLAVAKTTLRWLTDYKESNGGNLPLHEEIDFHIQQYKTLVKKFKMQLKDNHVIGEGNDISQGNIFLLNSKLIEIERVEVLQLWDQRKISHAIKNKLIHQLDLRAKHVAKYEL